MARVTVEDCVREVPNRFELVMMSAQRSRDISNGMPLLVERDRDKNPVVALREIGSGLTDTEQLKDSLVRGLQKHVDQDEPEEEDQLEAAAAALLGEESAGTSGQSRPEGEESAGEGGDAESDAEAAKAAAAALFEDVEPGDDKD